MISNRPSVDTVLMEIAAVFSTRSTCSRGQTGCVLARDGRVVSTGYNGAPAGMPHCDHTCDCSPSASNVHATWCRCMKPCTTAVHAEVNAIAFAAKHGVSTQGTTLYTLFAPCSGCAPLIVNAGIVRIVVGRLTGPSPRSSVGGGLDLLEQAGIPVEVLEGVSEGTS